MRISDWSSDVCSSDLRRGGSTVALCGPWASTCQRNPAKTGACEVDWIAGTVTQLDRPTSDEQLVEAVLSVDMAAIDVPLGWPDAFIDAVVAHRDRRGWPPIAPAPPEARLPLRYRPPDPPPPSSRAPPPSTPHARRLGKEGVSTGSTRWWPP